MPSFDVDPVKHKTAKTQNKIRAKAILGSNESEKNVAKSKLRRPEELPRLREEKMTSVEMKKEKSLKKKYDDSGMKASMIKQYGPEKGKQVYFATIRKQAMANSFEPEGEQVDEIAPLVAGGLALGGALLGAKLLSDKMKQDRKDVQTGGAKAKPGTIKSNIQQRNQQLRDLMTQSFDYNDAYEYMIEMLVNEDYAENYDSAETMFEHISTEFTAVLLEQYLEEKARGTRKKSTVHAYDVDETLFAHGKGKKPNVKVHVKDASGKRVKSLSNQEFNTHKLEKGHSYDFSEFGSAKKFRETSTPNKKVVKHIQRKVARGENVHLITARSKFDKPHEFHAHLKSHGIDVPMKNIHYTGGMKGGDIGDKKVKVANAVAKQHGASKVHMYDDAPKVHKSFEGEKKQKPTSMKYKTHIVKPDKSGESKVRSYQATKEEMSAYEYWKQFIN